MFIQMSFHCLSYCYLLLVSFLPFCFGFLLSDLLKAQLPKGICDPLHRKPEPLKMILVEVITFFRALLRHSGQVLSGWCVE